MQKEVQNKITRILYLLNEMDKGKINLKTQANMLGVNVRTLQRDIKVIEEAEFPLYCPQAGIYAFAEGFSLQKMKLSGKEASLLIFMSEIANTLGEDFGKSFQNLKRRFIAERDENPYFIKMLGGAEYESSEITRNIERAVRDREMLKIFYAGGRQEGYYENIKPLKIAWYEGFWYLIAIVNENDLFKFRLSKVTEAVFLCKNFTRDANINKILKESVNVWFEGKREREVIITVAKDAADYFKRKTYFPLQKIIAQNKDGSLTISCKIANHKEIIPTILYWMPLIAVVSPRELSDEIKELVKEYLKTLK
jgi:predicted DNA-binding transcriptional regulator YafY